MDRTSFTWLISLIETVHWENNSFPDEQWYLRDYIISNGKYHFYITGWFTKGKYTLNIAGSMPANDICLLTPGKSSPPEYYSLISNMDSDKIELRYYPSEQKLRIIDGGHRFDKDNYGGDYDCVVQKIAKYPKGAIIFTALGNKDFHSVVMIPYVDGSADFIVDEKYTYYCEKYTKSDIALYTRVYKFTKNGKEAVLSTSVGNDTEASLIMLSGKQFEFDDDLYRAFRADLTKY